jgi:hypothetical protein
MGIKSGSRVFWSIIYLMKYFLLLVLFISAACSGGGGESSPVAGSGTTITDPVTNPDGDGNPDGDENQIVDDNPDTESPEVADGDDEDEDDKDEMEEIVGAIDEAELERINRVLESENHEVTLTAMEDFDTHFDVQKTNVYSINETSVMYLFAHKRKDGKLLDEAMDIFKIQDLGKKVVQYKGGQGALGRIRTVYHHANSPLIVTNKPISIVSVNDDDQSVKLLGSPYSEGLRRLNEALTTANKLSLKATGKNSNYLCGYLNTSGFAPFIYDVAGNSLAQLEKEVAKPDSGKISGLMCEKNALYFLTKQDDFKQVYRFDMGQKSFSVIMTNREQGSKINFYHRDGQNFIRLLLPKNESREKRVFEYYQLSNAQLAKVERLPAAQKNPYGRIRSYISSSNSSLDDPHLEVLLTDKSKKDLPEDIVFRVDDVANYNPQVNSLKMMQHRLFALSQGNVLYEYGYDENGLKRMGPTLGYAVQSLTSYQDRIYMVANGNRLLEYDPQQDWSYGKLTHALVKRNSEEHNPKLIKQFKDLNLRSLQGSYPARLGLLLKGQLKDKNGNLLFNYDPLGDVVAEKYQSMENHDITSIFQIEDELIIGNKFNKSHKLFESSFSGSISWLGAHDLVQKESMIPYDGKKSVSDVKIVDDGIMSFIADNELYIHNMNAIDTIQLLRYRGLSLKKAIVTPNNKLLTISEGKVLLINPGKMELRQLFEIDSEQLASIRSAALFDDKLILIDRNKKVHTMHLSYADLNLFDDEVLDDKNK